MRKFILKILFFCISSILFGCNVSMLSETIAVAMQPLPTASLSYENLSIRKSLISADINCILPCFMELKPGETTRGELENVLKNIRNTPFKPFFFDDGVTYETSLSQRSNGRLHAGFTVRNNYLDTINLWLTQPGDWLPKNILLLPDLLNMLGEPDDVFILIAGPPLSLTMVVVYNGAGVMVNYRAYFRKQVAHQLENTDDPFLICLTPSYVDIDYLEAWLVNPKNKNLVEDKIPDLRDSERDVRPFWSIEKMAGINTQQFTDFFVKNPEGCLEAPSMKQLKAAGYVF